VTLIAGLGRDSVLRHAPGFDAVRSRCSVAARVSQPATLLPVFACVVLCDALTTICFCEGNRSHDPSTIGAILASRGDRP
jgi:hypothetical protein